MDKPNAISLILLVALAWTGLAFVSWEPGPIEPIQAARHNLVTVQIGQAIEMAEACVATMGKQAEAAPKTNP